MASLPYWAIGIFAGVLALLLQLSAATGTLLAVVLVLLTPLPLFIAGLGWGTGSALIGGLAGAFLMSLLGGIQNGLVFFCVAALGPVMLTRFALLNRTIGGSGAAAEARAARAREAHHRAVAAGEVDGPAPAMPEPEVEWYPPGRLVMWMTGVGAVLMVFTILSMMGAEGGIRGALFQMLNTGYVDNGELGRWLDARGFAITPAEFLQGIVYWVPPFVAAIWVMMSLVNMAIAQIVLERSQRNLRPTPDLTGFGYPRAFSYLLPLAFLLAFAPGEAGYVGLCLLIVFAVPYFLLGLAVIHVISRGWQARTPFLVMFYLVLLLVIWAALLVSLVGIAESWAGLRDRFRAPPDSA